MMKTYFWSFRIHNFMTSEKLKVFLIVTIIQIKSNMDISEYKQSKGKKYLVSFLHRAREEMSGEWKRMGQKRGEKKH